MYCGGGESCCEFVATGRAWVYRRTVSLNEMRGDGAPGGGGGGR